MTIRGAHFFHVPLLYFVFVCVCVSACFDGVVLVDGRAGLTQRLYA